MQGEKDIQAFEEIQEEEGRVENRQEAVSPLRQVRASTIVPPKLFFNHSEFGKYADTELEKADELGEGINLRIDTNETRGGSFMKYVVYHIVGEDKNGKIDVFRRFNEFHKMRTAMSKRFPGCFIPSIPDKSISIVDSQIANKRQRYLNDFVRKVTKLSHLYWSEEFQALLRSESKDLSSNFDKWPSPTTSEIINNYKNHFHGLAGKVITTEVRTQIHDFGKLIAKTEKSMLRFKEMAKDLAGMRDKYDHTFPLLFSKHLPSFEHQCLLEVVQDQSELIATNQNEAKFMEHEAVVRQSLRQNPYWLLYDLIRHQERDSRAFLEAISAVEAYENKKYELELKISENSKTINQLILQKKSSSEQKYKLEIQNENFKKEKEAVECLTDIIIALVAYVEIERFKREKTLFYHSFLQKLGGYEINMVQNMVQIWKDWNIKSSQLIQKYALP